MKVFLGLFKAGRRTLYTQDENLVRKEVKTGEFFLNPYHFFVFSFYLEGSRQSRLLRVADSNKQLMFSFWFDIYVSLRVAVAIAVVIFPLQQNKR